MSSHASSESRRNPADQTEESKTDADQSYAMKDSSLASSMVSSATSFVSSLSSNDSEEEEDDDDDDYSLASSYDEEIAHVHELENELEK